MASSISQGIVTPALVGAEICSAAKSTCFIVPQLDIKLVLQAQLCLLMGSLAIQDQPDYGPLFGVKQKKIIGTSALDRLPDQPAQR
jgi:hypothetical protein